MALTLNPGSRFGQFDILASLGAGGMGEVYRARDGKLQRDVALKVLPADVANDAERLARFRREAQLLAALNHPNIAHVYGLEEADGATALVMELAPGEDVAKRIARGAIPIGEALTIARQIAVALEAAHEAGIVHRDLKPANIKLTDEGVVKVLDFGLAKAIGPATGIRPPSPGYGGAGPDGVLDSPTITTPAMTQAGMILGTAVYMAPEQAKGRPVDKRADVWAFGCVLYEMLTGVRAFEGEDVSDTLASILRAEPDWSRLPTNVPESVQQLIRGCLEKDRRARVPDIGVARFLLDDKFAAPASTRTAPSAPSFSRRVAAIAAIAAFAVGVLVALLIAAMRPAPIVQSPPPGRFAVMTEPAMFIPATGGGFSISADGSLIVYVAGANPSETYLVVRPLESLTATRLEGTVGARFPFFSPDNKWVGYFAGGELRKISISGGRPITLCTFNGLPRGGTWSEDGTIVFATTLDLGLMQVSSSGGAAKPVTRTFDDSNRPIHMFPSFLPGGRSVLFSILPPGETSASTATVDLTTGVITTIQTDGGFIPTYVPSGYLVSDRSGRLEARRFDLATGKVSGDPVTMVNGITQNSQGFASYAMSNTGVLIYTTATGNSAQRSRTLVWVDRQGKENSVGVPTRSYELARISPDGTRIAADSRDEENDIWIWDAARRTLSRLTVGSSDEMGPIWSRDGSTIYYSSNRSGVPNIYRQRADGAGAVERLTDVRRTQFLTAIDPLGTRLAMFDFADANEAISVVPINGPLPATEGQVVIKADASHRLGPEISPDGRWLAFHSNEAGPFEVYVRPFPNVDSARWQISSGGGTRAAWSRDGRELFYLDAHGLLTSVIVSMKGDLLSPGTPKQVLTTPYVAGASARGLDLRSYDVSADGQRFLMVKDVAPAQPITTSPVPFIVVTHWMDELKQRVPASR